MLQAIQDLMKSNAVDCQINQYENDNEVACITLPGTPQQYAFHPNLLKDIAETSTKFREDAQEAQEAQEAQGQKEGQEKQQQEKQQPKGPKTVKAFEIVIDKVPYLAVPVLQKGQITPLSYDLFARGDIRRTKKIGTSLADLDGNPTSDIQFSK